MKQGQTFHPITCDCGFCKSGETRFPIPCQSTFKEHCKYPKCDCDRPTDDYPAYTAKMYPAGLDPIQNNCTYGYVLPDRCRYTAHLGCDCGAYPPLKWDGEKYGSPREMVHK